MKKPYSSDADQACFRTYMFCMNTLAEGVGIEIPKGPGLRSKYEELVERCATKLKSPGTGRPTASRPRSVDDFSRNEVLAFMHLAATGLAGRSRRRITRDAFIREALRVLQEQGGLERKRLHADASTGHYRWMDDHIQTFLRRHPETLKRDGADLLVMPAVTSAAPVARRGRPLPTALRAVPDPGTARVVPIRRRS